MRVLWRGGHLRPVICQLCGQIGSLSHLVSCVRVGGLPSGRTLLPDYLAELASRGYSVNPNFPALLRLGKNAEIALAASDADDGLSVLLDFEDDAETRLMEICWWCPHPMEVVL